MGIRLLSELAKDTNNRALRSEKYRFRLPFSIASSCSSARPIRLRARANVLELSNSALLKADSESVRKLFARSVTRARGVSACATAREAYIDAEGLDLTSHSQHQAQSRPKRDPVGPRKTGRMLSHGPVVSRTSPFFERDVGAT